MQLGRITTTSESTQCVRPRIHQTGYMSSTSPILQHIHHHQGTSSSREPVISGITQGNIHEAPAYIAIYTTATDQRDCTPKRTTTPEISRCSALPNMYKTMRYSYKVLLPGLDAPGPHSSHASITPTTECHDRVLVLLQKGCLFDTTTFIQSVEPLTDLQTLSSILSSTHVALACPWCSFSLTSALYY